MPTARESSERSWLANLAIAKHEFDTKGYITINNAWKSSTFNGRVSGRTNLEPWQKEMLVDFGFPTRAENKLMRAASKNATKERNIMMSAFENMAQLMFGRCLRTSLIISH